MKQKEGQKHKMLFGIKEGGKSFKLYQVNENEFLIIEKRYLMNIFLTRKTLKFNNKDQAEDYIIHNTKKFHVVSI